MYQTRSQVVIHEKFWAYMVSSTVWRQMNSELCSLPLFPTSMGSPAPPAISMSAMQADYTVLYPNLGDIHEAQTMPANYTCTGKICVVKIIG